MPDDDEEYEEFVCPISQLVMKDPVMTVDGHSYERLYITEWLRRG